MLPTEAAAHIHLRDVVRMLNALRYQLLGLAATLPDLEPGEPGEGDAPADPAAELRSAIDCVLADRILPAIVDLAAATRVPPQM